MKIKTSRPKLEPSPSPVTVVTEAPARTQEELRDRDWEEVKSPVTWRPREGEDLMGYYLGVRPRKGAYGSYEVAVLLVPSKGLFIVSGVTLITLITSAGLEKGELVRIIFHGRKDTDPDEHGSVRKMKVFRLQRPLPREILTDEALAKLGRT